jgi:Adenylyl/Guanylyl and SMODS C-terminal sensor domain
MAAFIENRNGKWWVTNPVDPDENFADKWNEYPERREAFMHWLKKVEADFARLSRAETLPGGLTMLDESLGSGTMSKVARELGVPRQSLPLAIVTPSPSAPALSDARHARSPAWPSEPRYNVRISAGVHHKKAGRRLWAVGSETVPKRVWLRFEAISDAPEPYSIQWQVVNTGQEAERAGQGRGEFYESNSDRRVRWESTAYRGTHWVEAFVLRAGVCVARSGRFLVKIR